MRIRKATCFLPREVNVPEASSANVPLARIAAGSGGRSGHHADSCGVKFANGSATRFSSCSAWRRSVSARLVFGDTGIDRGHDITPLVTNLMKIGVADAAEENLDLHVALGRIAPWDRVRGERRCFTGGGVGFSGVCVVHAFVLLIVLLAPIWRLRRSAIRW